MLARMVQKAKQSTSTIEWLYRGVLMFLATSIYMDVKEIPVHGAQIEILNKKDAHQDEEIKRLKDVIFVPSWERHIRQQSHMKETDRSIDYTTELIQESDSVIKLADQILSNIN